MHSASHYLSYVQFFTETKRPTGQKRSRDEEQAPSDSSGDEARRKLHCVGKKRAGDTQVRLHAWGPDAWGMGIHSILFCFGTSRRHPLTS